VLSIAIGFAVPILGGWHVYMVARGETSIESHDNDYLERKAKEEGLVSARNPPSQLVTLRAS
jgi:palmitoyltransferase